MNLDASVYNRLCETRHFSERASMLVAILLELYREHVTPFLFVKQSDSILREGLWCLPLCIDSRSQSNPIGSVVCNLSSCEILYAVVLSRSRVACADLNKHVC